jgi:hypothetical protein
MIYVVEMISRCIIYIPKLMNIAIGAQAILMFCLRNLRRRNVGNIDGRVL